MITDLKNKVVKESVADAKGDALNTTGDDALTELHMANFLDAIRTGAKLNSPIEDGAKTGMLCHLGTIAQQTGRKLHTDPKTGHILGDADAMKLWSREYAPGGRRRCESQGGCERRGARPPRRPILRFGSHGPASRARAVRRDSVAADRLAARPRRSAHPRRRRGLSRADGAARHARSLHPPDAVRAGVPLESLGVPRRDGGPVERDPRRIWQRFAEHYHLFRGTPTGAWLDYQLHELFGVRKRLDGGNALQIYDEIDEKLATPEFRPRALFERFNIEVLATTDAAIGHARASRGDRALGVEGPSHSDIQT